MKLPQRKVAVVDIGSNSTKILVALVNTNGEVVKVREEGFSCRLIDKGNISSPIISPKKRMELCSGLSRLLEICTQEGVSDPVLVATEAIRTSLNAYEVEQEVFDNFSKKIREGQTYQIKICTKYKNKSEINPVNFFWKLMKINSSPESFMIRDKDYSIVSCSPETLIDRKGNTIITKPIAGTLKKNKFYNKLKALKYFRNNNKETKEHNMIVDLERNDLSRICKPGTVEIKKEKYVEEYKHLYHYVTSIAGRIKKNISVKEIITAMMPGGSVIGCPKIKTLQLLNSQEKEDRNIFTGSFGFIKFNEDMRFNIIIRSILNFKKQSEISAASGVVLDSAAKKEFNENFIKAKSLLELFK